MVPGVNAMRTLRIVLPFLALAFAAGCSSRVAARPGVGVGVEHRADGGRLGIDLGSYDVDNAAVHPVTGDCPGGVCGIPGAPASLPTLKVEPKIPGAVLWAGGLFALAVLGGLAVLVVRKVAK